MPRGGKPKVYPPKFVQQVRRLYNQGMTQVEVAAELGTTLKVIRRVMYRHEIPRRTQRTQRHKERLASSLQGSWDKGMFPREHPPDCPHCVAVKKPRYPNGRPLKTVEKFKATVRAKREPSYASIHTRVKSDLGRAAAYSCSCGKPATDWALKHSTPARFLRISTHPKRKGLAYSIRVQDYEAKCRACHLRADKIRREQRVAKGGSR